MVNLAQLTQSQSFAQTSGSGFGTRMLCRRLTQHSAAPVEGSLWLTGLRRANAFNATTNPVPNAHMRSPGGFVETFPGLRDAGDIMFEATYKNDEAEFGTPMVDIQRWQAPEEGDAEANKSFFHSIFYDREPFEAWVIPPLWTKGIAVARGYASMMGPIPHELEAPVNFQGSFKISGKPMLLRGKLLGTLTTADTLAMGEVVSDAIPTQTPAITAAVAENKRYRAVSANLLEEIWSGLGNGTDVPGWGEVGASSLWSFYEYTEDEGFGDAF